MKYILTIIFLAVTLIATTNYDEVIYFSYEDGLATGWKTKIKEAYIENRAYSDTNAYPEPIIWIAYTNAAGDKIWGSAEWTQHMFYQGCTGLFARITAKVPPPFLHTIVVTNTSFLDRGYYQVGDTGD